MSAAQQNVKHQARVQGVLNAWEFDTYGIYQVGADLGGEAYLLATSDGGYALFDTGFAFCADQTLNNIYTITGGAPVDYIVLTHSHYDHCAATGYLLEHMPHAQVIASEHAAHVFTRPGAYRIMRELNKSRAVEKGAGDDYVDVYDNIPVHLVVQDGDTFTVGNMEFQAVSAVGHTKCCMAYWCAAAGLFFSTETAGVPCESIPQSVSVPDDVHYMIDFIELITFRGAIEHIERIKGLPIRVYVSPHYGVLAGDEVADMWVSVDFWVRFIRDFVIGRHEQGQSDEEIIAAYKEIFYWGGTAPYQPEAAFDMNASYAIPTIIREYCSE
ncbi:MAG: MBL fold metallo-hydrolase [Eggerthellaceae bacterium]|nr:MBL fold metallo-hydrolase [Eggerthellaceae bacterium]